MAELTNELRTLFNAADPAALYVEQGDHAYDAAIARFEASLKDPETPEHVHELLENVFQDVYGPKGDVDLSYLAHEVSDLLGALGM